MDVRDGELGRILCTSHCWSVVALSNEDGVVHIRNAEIRVCDVLVVSGE